MYIRSETTSVFLFTSDIVRRTLFGRRYMYSFIQIDEIRLLGIGVINVNLFRRNSTV